MSSFEHPHQLYLFQMKNGKKKLAYGRNPADALEILSTRLSDEEMAAIDPARYCRIRYQDIMHHVPELG